MKSEFFKPADGTKSIDELTPEQQEDFELAYDMTLRANEVFNKRKKVAEDIAKGISRYTNEEFGNCRVAAGFTREIYNVCDVGYQELLRIANTLMPGRAAFDKSQPSESATSLEAKEGLVDSVRGKLFARYEKYGVSEADFRLISYEDKQTGETIYSVIYAGERGIDLGDPSKGYDKRRSYNSIMVDDTGHVLTIDGTEYDDRGLNWSTYETFINSEREAGTSLVPDSRTYSHLPSEGADDDVSLVGYSDDGRPVSHWNYRDSVYRSVLFRPAVVITKQLADLENQA